MKNEEIKQIIREKENKVKEKSAQKVKEEKETHTHPPFHTSSGSHTAGCIWMRTSIHMR